MIDFIIMMNLRFVVVFFGYKLINLKKQTLINLKEAIPINPVDTIIENDNSNNNNNDNNLNGKFN